MTYRRRIRLVAPESGIVVGDLEDDFHRFRVALGHDGERVTTVLGAALRYPWSTCPDAAAPLRELEGAPLFERVTHAAHFTAPRANCTHMFDLAGLAVTHAAAERVERRYDATLPPPTGRIQTATLERDGEPYLEWVLEWGADGERRCIEPPPFSDTRWRGGFMRWADEALDPETAEAAIVLRRACDIGMGHGMDLDRYPRAADIEFPMVGACYTMQPERIEVAFRNRGTIRDFTDRPDALLADLGEGAGSDA